GTWMIGGAALKSGDWETIQRATAEALTSLNKG
ncbi:MAG TPA: keto-deoxy-phosphogluconate aldolase, partial [Pseudomonas sp.]|nr:keto-deoxy-phosphogluconate aldolase [Pseudomonas sp.]